VRKAISIKDELENWAIDHFIWNHARFFFVSFFCFVFVLVLYLSFFLGSFLYLFLFFPFFHFFLSIYISCEWVINRLKVGCKFSTIRFVLLLQCCLLIVCPGYIYTGDSWMAAFPSFSTTYRRFLQKAQFLRILPPPPNPLFVFEYVWLARWLWKQQSKKWNGFDANEGQDLMDATSRMAYSYILYLFIYLFISYSRKCLCVGGSRVEEKEDAWGIEKKKKKRKRYVVYVRAV
jgi:hypothetical protein